MGKQWLKFLGFSSIFAGIIIFSIVFGGYSSLYRSENRIADSKELLFNKCRERLDLLPQLVKSLQTSEQKEEVARLEQISEKAESLILLAGAQKTPMDNSLTLKFEISQGDLTKELAKVFIDLKKSSQKNSEALKIFKEAFLPIQNELSSAKARYNTEVRYFETRTKIFPGFLIAKLFGFNKRKYFELSENSFAIAKDVFGEKES